MTVSPFPVDDDALRILHLNAGQEPGPRWTRIKPQLRAAAAGTLVGLIIAGLMGATYNASPGGTLWPLQKTVFSTHAQNVALRAVVSSLKNAQDILGTGNQPNAQQLTDSRNLLNDAKQEMTYVSASPERDSLQNLYLQLTQQLRQYTPGQTQQLPSIPTPINTSTDSTLASPPDPAASPPPPTWGYATSASADTPVQDYAPPPPPADIPAEPAADWPAPIDPPLTPNLEDLGGYDPSWLPLYGYNPLDWFNWGLSGFNRYGYDFLGFDRWGYDRWGYDRWGYDRYGYNWGGYNWAGYDRDGWDRDGRNEWGQHRDRDNDPRDQDWYDRHHPYQQYYDWKFRNTDQVYNRTQWDQARGFNPQQYQGWNSNRNWNNAFDRDWAPVAVHSADAMSEPVVNLNTSLTQFIAADKATESSKKLLDDLSNKSVRDMTKDLSVKTPVSAPSATPGASSTPPVAGLTEKALTPPALTAPAPSAPPSKVDKKFVAPELPPVPVYTPPAEPKSTTSTSTPNGSSTPSSQPAESTPSTSVSTPPSNESKSETPASSPSTSASHSPVETTQPTPTSVSPTPTSATPAPSSTPRHSSEPTPSVSQPPVQETSAPVVPPVQDTPKSKPVPSTPVQQSPEVVEPTHETPPPARSHEAPPPSAEPKPEPKQTQQNTPAAPAPAAPTYTTQAPMPGFGSGSSSGSGSGSNSGSGSGSGHH